ncbi:hypothetical protein LB557_24645 [Mesorhizobium sp. BR115XR7A]|uniref:hypothetical protein n=1 Tax=Mesorhizobium sp. BR115XR7A TaxID=2876645 RepID=UPI001CC91E30|nr:hypothetical protein [Mesorhizobium sp. BR115XR7A]MBZ9909203.1 hypothetical protein [Mesorhizobium sp. BR115XR7A]MBZ9930449.1 hypothetical protein [Mesorhizobium sp. BR1-1-5]
MTEMVEPCVVQDTFVQGVGRVEELSKNLFRVSYFANQRAYDGSQERVCVAKFVVTFETMLAMSQATVKHTEISDEVLFGPTGSARVN